jgi:site-specific DNA recombinase
VYQSYNYRETNKNTQTYYVCYSRDKISKAYIVDPNCPNGYHRADILEDWVIHQLRQYSLNEKMLRRLAKELLACGDSRETKTKLTSAKKEMDGLQRKLTKWYDAFEKDVISADDLFERIRDLRKRKKMLEEEIVHLEEAAIDEAARIISVQDIIDTIRNFDVVWAEATHEEHRAILASLIEKITVAQDGTIIVVIGSE